MNQKITKSQNQIFKSTQELSQSHTRLLGPDGDVNNGDVNGSEDDDILHVRADPIVRYHYRNI